jgi:hypothetical protein
MKNNNLNKSIQEQVIKAKNLISNAKKKGFRKKQF